MSKTTQDPGRGIWQRECAGIGGIHEHVFLVNLESECVCVFSLVNISPDQLERRKHTWLFELMF